MADYHMKLRSATKRKGHENDLDGDNITVELDSVSDSFIPRYGYIDEDEEQDMNEMNEMERRKAAMAHFYLHGSAETSDNNLTTATNITPTNTDDLYSTTLLDDRTTPPPPPDLESFFPPSPYGKTRKQVYGDRFIPQRDPNLTRDFQLMDPASSRSTRASTDLTEQEAASNLEARRMFFFYRSEVLNDPHAYTNFMESEAAIANNQVRTPRRLYHYTSPREEHRTLPHNNSNSNSNYTIADDASSSGEGHNSNDDNNNNNNNNNNSSDNNNNNNSTGNSIHSDLSGRNITSLLRSVDESNDFFSPSTPSVRYRPSPVSDTGLRILGAHQYPSRFINRTAIKILDAPELEDDFYLNLVDWGPNDCLAVGLGNCVYLWDANTSRVMKLCEFPTERITSVCWAQQGKHLAIGTNGANMQLWDVRASKRLRTWQNHKGRVSSLAWNMNILTSGSKDHHIFHHDIRSPMPYFRDMNVHHQEVCGLKWSLDGSMLASGGNDNKLMIWSSHENLVMHKFSEHTAAVKAIAWCPYDRSLLVSGGGTADKSIKFWNAQRGALLDSFDTGSQVCNVVWSKRSKEIVSTHGYANQHANASNQVVVWNAKTMNRVATLTGHTSRVLFMSMDTNGSTVVTGAGDETLRFWDVFGSVDPQRKGVDRAVILR